MRRIKYFFKEIVIWIKYRCFRLINKCKDCEYDDFCYNYEGICKGFVKKK